MVIKKEDFPLWEVHIKNPIFVYLKLSISQGILLKLTCMVSHRGTSGHKDEIHQVWLSLSLSLL